MRDELLIEILREISGELKAIASKVDELETKIDEQGKAIDARLSKLEKAA